MKNIEKTAENLAKTTKNLTKTVKNSDASINEKFAMSAWKLFDKYIQKRIPNIDAEHRYMLAESFDKEIETFIKRVENIEQAFYKS